ncbi:MAG: hypothetical protein K8R87_09410 [Verrucomicrobia bacterium]|nr:hypothetical protein [Verrucomicrobiota bacterium]
MWLFTVHGFYSIVQKGDLFHVRAREKHDLENLRELIPGLPMVQDSYKGSDYPFRLLLDENQKNAVIEALSESIDYPNFKSAVGERDDQRAKLGKYHDVWGVMAE